MVDWIDIMFGMVFGVLLIVIVVMCFGFALDPRGMRVAVERVTLDGGGGIMRVVFSIVGIVVLVRLGPFVVGIFKRGFGVTE